MASIEISPDPDAIVSEIHIAAPPERVFQALVEPRQVLEWWGQAGVYRCTDFDSDLRVGGKWRSAGEGGASGRFVVAGEYLEVDFPRLLVYSWIASWTGDVKTTVRWELIPSGGGTHRQTSAQRTGDASRDRPNLPRLATNARLAEVVP